ncbi:MAG: patatin-like phospholipase family protein [Dysgonamonadaceae bacterium]|jgi:NTE family protein|nr:patatin-like phospholipase family protein [Dysgonamonadaceae bacterium]
MGLFGKKYPFHLGYALGGGGAKGFAHLGALKVLEEYGLKPDIISGTSAGALAGVFYADGYSPDEIIELFEKTEFREFAELSIPKGGFFKTDGLHHFLKKNLRAKTFEELKIPFAAVATDWNKARYVSFAQGKNLVDTVVASCTVPVVFNPQYIEGVPYVDGGLLKNFPVSVIRPYCKYVIGINVSLLVPTEEKISVIGMAERTFKLMSNSNSLYDRKLCDILIEVKGVEKYALFNLKDIETIANIGYQRTFGKITQPGVRDIIRKCVKDRS